MHTASIRTAILASALLAGLAGPVAAQPQPRMGQNETEAQACLDRLIRDIPTYRALRDLRDRAAQRGFRVVSKSVENYDFQGQAVYIYAVQVTGEAEAYRLACVF